MGELDIIRTLEIPTLTTGFITQHNCAGFVVLELANIHFQFIRVRAFSKTTEAIFRVKILEHGFIYIKRFPIICEKNHLCIPGIFIQIVHRPDDA